MFDASRITLEWLAGFFDGEGSVKIGANGNSISVQVTITQKNEPLLLEIQRLFPDFTGPYDTGKGVSRIYLNGQKSCYFLKKIRPFLVLKGTQVDLALFALLFLQSYGNCGGFGMLPESVGRMRDLISLACSSEKKGEMSTETFGLLEKELENCLRSS